MDKKTLTIILAVALIGAFFLPFYNYMGKASGLDIVTGPGKDWQKYLPLLFPICGVLLLIGALNNNYILSRSLLTILPLLGVLYIMIVAPLIAGGKISLIFKAIPKIYGVGMWITVVSSVILAFYNPRPR